jgi:hypothetical protein
MGYLEGKAERNEALLRMFGHLQESEEPVEPEGKPDFDGGVREPTPLPSDPVQEHNKFLLALVRDHRSGGGAS